MEDEYTIEDKYTLSFTAEEIDAKLSRVAATVCFTEQTLTPEQQAKARANIGAAAVGEGGGSGTLKATDDGNGNVELIMSGNVTITEDGEGNVVIARGGTV